MTINPGGSLPMDYFVVGDPGAVPNATVHSLIVARINLPVFHQLQAWTFLMMRVVWCLWIGIMTVIWISGSPIEPALACD